MAEEKGISEIFQELTSRVAALENEVASLRTQLYHTLRSSDIDDIAKKVEQSLVRQVMSKSGGNKR